MPHLLPIFAPDRKSFPAGKIGIFDTKHRFSLFLALIIARFLRNASIFSHIFGYISANLVQNVQESVPSRPIVLCSRSFVLHSRIFGVRAMSRPRRSKISVFLFLALVSRSRSAQKQKNPGFSLGFSGRGRIFPSLFDTLSAPEGGPIRAARLQKYAPIGEYP